MAAKAAWCIALLCWGLWAPSQSLLDLGGLLGSGSASGKGGLLSSVGGVGSGSGGSDGGLLDSAAGALLGGGSQSGNGGLLGSAIGGGLSAGGLLNNTAGGLLGGGSQSGNGGLLAGALGEKGLLGEEGLVGGNLLGQDGLLGGNKSLQGLLGLEGLLPESGGSKEPFSWWDALSLEIVRGSWKIIRGAELVLNLQARVTMKLPGQLKFLSGSSVEMNITAHLAVAQDKPGDLKLVLKNCQDLLGGVTIHLRRSLLTSLVGGAMNAAVRTLMPALMCPVFQSCFHLINEQLRVLNDNVFSGLLGKIHTALSSMPVSTGQFSEMDFKDKPFPAVFLQWLLKAAGPVAGQKSS